MRKIRTILRVVKSLVSQCRVAVEEAPRTTSKASLTGLGGMFFSTANSALLVLTSSLGICQDLEAMMLLLGNLISADEE